MTHPGKHRSVPRHSPTLNRGARRRMGAIAAGVAFAVVAAVAVPLTASALTTGTVSLDASQASWVTARQPSTTHDRYPYLSATRSADRTLVQFPTATLPDDKKIVSATLTVRVLNSAASTGGFQVFPTSTAWKASTLTMNNKPAAGADAVNAALVKARPGTTVSIPLDPKALTTKADGSFELAYSQPYVGNTFSTPKLSVVLGDAGSPSAPIQTPTPTPTSSAPPATTPTPTPTPTSGAPTAPTQPAPPATGTNPPVTVPSATGIGGSFAIPAPGTSTKKVFAHYFPPYPVSIDNQDPDSDYYVRNYLDPNGENGKHVAYGGLLRDRPVGREPLSGDWRTTDLETEVNQASDAGIDGFTVNVMSWAGQNWDTTLRLMQAAQNEKRGFTVTPNIDASSGAVDASPATIAASLAKLYSYPSAYRLSDGRYLLSSFAAENKAPSWWSSVMSTLKNSYGINVAFVAVLQNASSQNMAAFAPISYSLSNWGARTPNTIKNTPNLAASAHALGVKWTQPVAVQDSRPNGGKYAEANNTEALRASWQKAIGDGADMVQIATWNDYSENTAVAPSANHGVTFLDASAYYLAQFKTGAAPTITKDSMYVTHRNQFTTSKPQIGRVETPNLDGTSTPPRNTVEVLTMLTAPATLTVKVGGTVKTIDVPAGVTSTTVPLATGTVSATAVRDGKTVLQGTSPYTVTNTPKVNDFEYFGFAVVAK